MSSTVELLKPWVIVLVYVIIIVFCTIGNSLVLYVILTRNHMRTVTNCFIASLSVSDLLVGLVVVSLATVQTVSTGTIHGSACQLPIYFESICCTASVYSLLAITFDRYRAVILSTTKTFTIQKSIFVIIGVWVWSFVYASKVFILFSVSQHGAQTNHTEAGEEEEETFCNLLVEEDDDDFWFRVADAILLFTVPFIVMTFMYTRIARRLWFTKIAVSSAVRNKRKVVKFLIFDIILFFVSWAPFYIVELIVDGLRLMSVLSEEEEEELENAKWFIIFRFVLVILALSNSFMNTILYAFFNGNFQAEIKSMFKLPKIGGKVTPQSLPTTKSSLDKTPLPGISSVSGLSKLEHPSNMVANGDEKQEDRGWLSYQSQNGKDSEAQETEARNTDWNF